MTLTPPEAGILAVATAATAPGILLGAVVAVIITLRLAAQLLGALP